jgi:hypothetical protein
MKVLKALKQLSNHSLALQVNANVADEFTIEAFTIEAWRIRFMIYYCVVKQ